MSKIAVADILRAIHTKPLDPELWEALRDAVAAKPDEKGAQTLTIVAQGLREVGEADASMLTGLQKSVFLRLSKSYVNPTLVKELGVIHLNEFRLPEAARDHFLQAKALGLFDPDLNILIAQAEEAIKNQGQVKEAAESVDQAEHARPKPAEVIRKTGKLAMTADKLLGLAVADTEAATDDTDAVAEDQVPLEFLDAMAMAVEEAGSRRYRKAVRVAEIITKRESDTELTSSVWTNLGETFFRHGKFSEAERAYRLAKDLLPRDLRHWFNYGLAQHVLGEYDSALQSYTMADQAEPNHPKVWNNIGVLHFQQDRMNAAEMALRKALEAKPDYPRAWDNLAAALGAQEKFKEAAAAASKAIELREDFPEAWFKLGVLCFHNEQYTEADEAMANAESLIATSAYAMHYQSMICSRVGRPDEGVSHILKAIGLDPNCELTWMSWNEAGLAYAHQEAYDKAVAAYDKALTFKPGSTEVLFNVGVARRRTGDHELAELTLARLVQIDPMNFRAWHHLGHVYLELEKPADAVDCFEQQVELRPRRQKAWESLAQAYAADGQQERAEAAARQARKMSLHQQAA
ncbi:MAG: tetratricopeptide repeat protein [Verrucomicrobiota bacterium]